MNQSGQTDFRDHVLSAAERFERTRSRFEESWKDALTGGAPPDVDGYVSEYIPSEREPLRAELERIDQAYRPRLVVSGPTDANATSGQPGFPAETPRDLRATLDVHLSDATPSENTVDLGGQAGTQPQPAQGNLDLDWGTLACAVEAEPRTVERPTVTGYEILGELGRGGMGVVYRARQVKLNRVVALKMVLAGAHAGPEQLARFYTEAQAVAHLQHPNIVQIYEVSEQGGLPYFSLEFVGGGSLADKTKGKPQPITEAVHSVKALAEAMHYAHEHGVVHRDLKPANVLLTEGGIPKITDFGLAKRLEGESSAQTRSGAILGTPSYMAPEQALGAVHDVGPRTDVYALGAILYELLTGRPPFVGPTPMDTVVQVTRDEPVPPTQLQPKVPRDVETICLKCLEKEPTKRYGSATELAGDLSRFLNGEPILARPVSAPERLWRWCHRNPRVATLSGAVLLLLLTVAVGSTAMALRIQRARELAVQAQLLAETNEEAARYAQSIAEFNEETARQAEQKADRNAHIASDQGQMALRTLYDLVNTFQSELRDVPGVQELKQKLLDMALERLDGVEAGLDKVGHGTDSSELALRAAAGAYQRGGTILRDMGQIERALEKYKRCHEIVMEMEKSDPLNPTYKRNLAASCNNLATISERLGDTVSAQHFYRQALEAREKWGQLDPNSAEPKWQLANSYLLLGQVSLAIGDPASAERDFQESEKLRQTISVDSVPRAMFEQEWAWQYERMGDARLRLGDLTNARGYFNKAIELRKKLLDDAASRPGVQLLRDFASSCVKLGDLCFLFEQDTAQADNYYGQALQLCEQLRELDPRNSEVLTDLANTQYKLAGLNLRLGKTSASETYYRQCHAIREKLAEAAPQDQQARIDLMMALARCGRHAEAAAMADQIREHLPQNPAAQLKTGCCYSVCLAALAPETDDSQLSSEVRTLAERYRTAATAAIRQAISGGWKDAVTLRTNPDLDSIRTDSVFQELLESL